MNKQELSQKASDFYAANVEADYDHRTIQEWMTSFAADVLVEREAEIATEKALYNELIMAVSHKYKGESRHETALKYIQRAENSSGEACVNPEAFAALKKGEQ